MSYVLGIDFSTNHIDMVKLDESSNRGTWERFSPVGDTALDRLRHVPLVLPNYSWYDEVYIAAIEVPYGRGQAGTQAKLNRVFGAICAAIPASVELWAVGQAEWKKELGLKAKPSLDDLASIASGFTIDRKCDLDHNVSDDDWQNAYDGYCIALWARIVNARALAPAGTGGGG